MITTSLRRHDLVGNGTVGPFTYQFLIQDKTHLQVYVDGNLKTVDTHYTVAGVGNESGGTITFTIGNEPAVSAEILVLGAEPYTQLTDYVNAGSFPAASHEEALDKLTRLVAQQKEHLTRVPTLSLPDHYNKSALSLGALEAGEFIRVNSLENGLEGATPTTVPSGLPVGGNYDHLTVNGSGVVTWAQQVYNFSSGWLNISRYGNDLAAAVTAIGAVTKVTLVVSTQITVSGNVTVTPNIILFFVGAGELSIATGITVGYQGASFFADDLRRQRFSGLGEFNATNLAEVIPDQWGADATGVADSATAIQTAISSLNSTTGGTLRLLPGTYSHAVQITVDRPLVIVGAGIDRTILQLTANASLRCGLKSVTNGFEVWNLTVKTQTPPTTNLEMTAIRLDLFNTAVATGQRYHLENIKVRGYNVGPYCDGDDEIRVDSVIYRNLDVQCSGPAGDYIGSCFHVHRVKKFVADDYVLDKNNTGEHGMYLSEIENLKLGRGKIRNATRGGAWAIKMVSNVTGLTNSVWAFDDVDIEDCTAGIQCSLFLTNTLSNLSLKNIRIKDCGGVSGQDGTITVDLSDSASIAHVDLRAITLTNIQQKGFAFQGAVGTAIGGIIIDGVYAFNWSIASAGTHALIGATTTTTDIGLLSLANIVADGNTTNGRCIWDQSSMQSSVKRLIWRGLKQKNTTTQGWPITFTDLDTTPSVALGNVFYVNNTGATSITAFDDKVIGETYLLIFANGNTTLVNSANLLCPGGVNLTPGTNDIYSICTYNGTACYVSSGSNN